MLTVTFRRNKSPRSWKNPRSHPYTSSVLTQRRTFIRACRGATCSLGLNVWSPNRRRPFQKKDMVRDLGACAKNHRNHKLQTGNQIHNFSAKIRRSKIRLRRFWALLIEDHCDRRFLAENISKPALPSGTTSTSYPCEGKSRRRTFREASSSSMTRIRSIVAARSSDIRVVQGCG
jgi:hypothetical protein